MKRKGIIALVLSMCLLSVMGFALPNTGKPTRELSEAFSFLSILQKDNKKIKELPITVSENRKEQTFKIQVGEEVFVGKLEDNDTVKALVEKLPLNVNMEDLNSNEKFYFFEDKLPVKAERIGNIKAGDILLYGSDCLVLFYEDFTSSYSYTRIGHIDDVSKLKETLGKGDVTIMWSIDK